jgi:hypothetical protein
MVGPVDELRLESRSSSCRDCSMTEREVRHGVKSASHSLPITFGRGDAMNAKKKRCFLMLLVVAGLLLWARVIVIHKMPRMAIAEEEQGAIDDPPADNGISPTARPAIPPSTTSSSRNEASPKPTPVTDLASEADKSESEQTETQESNRRSGTAPR